MSQAKSKDGSSAVARLEVDAQRFIAVLFFVLVGAEVFLWWPTRSSTWGG